MKSAGPARLSPCRPHGAPKVILAAPRLSIVVLPFGNIGGGAEQEHFVDGVTESLTTDLSRLRGSLVIGRNTAFTYKGKHVDLKQIGREMNVRYVLEGSVQRGGNRMRCHQCAADRRRNGLQSFVGRALRQAPGRSLRNAGRDRCAPRQPIGDGTRSSGGASRAGSAESRFRGPLFSRLGVIQPRNYPGKHRAGARFFERALELDPNNIDASLGVGRVDANMGASFLSDDRSGAG